MIRGSCLCGSVVFEIEKAVGPFEFCHCTRCRKVSGSNGMAALGVLSRDYRLLTGKSCTTTYQAPILYGPPAYEVHFCSRCGSPVPPPDPPEFFEIAAGLLDNDPGMKPDKHIFVEFTPEWDKISDELPQYTVRELFEIRHGQPLPDDFETKTHLCPMPPKQ